jgi:hypothetical protein
MGATFCFIIGTMTAVIFIFRLVQLLKHLIPDLFKLHAQARENHAINLFWKTPLFFYAILTLEVKVLHPFPNVTSLLDKCSSQDIKNGKQLGRKSKRH